MTSARTDRRMVLWVLSGMVLLIALIAVFAPASGEEDTTPTTYNVDAAGWKGAYRTLEQLGYRVSRSTSPASSLDSADAANTTYVLASPNSPAEDVQRRDYDAVERFLRRGGRVIATGPRGAYFLPDGRSGRPTQFVGQLCNAVPEGDGVLAQVGSFALYDVAPWNAMDPLVRVDARCGADAVMVHREYPRGGAMIYLASSEPFSNRGLKQDQALHLLLLAVGDTRRTVIFDEFYRGEQVSPTDYLKGLPLRSLMLQAALVLLLLMFTYTRRSGPIREPMSMPRTSPLEFVESMGALYERAGVSQPATESARRRLINFMVSNYGLPLESAGSVETIGDFLSHRLGESQGELIAVLERLWAARYETLRPRDALALVRATAAEMERMQLDMKQQTGTVAKEMK